MALVGRSPVRVTAAPSTAPQEAMAASLQAHIDDLVQKNRTCEHTIRRLQQALVDEKERGIEVVSRLKAASLQEREEWREGCDTLLSSHRIVHLRTRIELDKERLSVLQEGEENRRERINILHRDYRLTLFQAKESELEAKVATLEDALQELTEEHEQDAWEYMERIATLEKDSQRANTLRKEASLRMKVKEAEFASLQSELGSLRKETSALKASSESSSVKLERATLQLEGAKTNLAELESANAELKRTNTDLKRQLERWQNLETKGGAEVEEMRKRRIEAEVQVKELEGRVKEIEKSEKESSKALERERSKVEKLKRENDRMAEVTEDAQSIAKKAQDEYVDAAKQLRTAQRLIEKLQSEKLTKDHGRKGKKPVHEIELPASEVETEGLDPSEREVEKVLTPAPKSRVRPRPAFRGNDVEGVQVSAEVQEEEAPQPTKPRARAKSNNRKQKAEEVGSSAEQDDDEPTQTKRTGKAQARTKDESSNTARKSKNKSPVESELEEEPEEDVEEKPSRQRKDKGKGKAIAPPSDSEDEPTVKTKGKSKVDTHKTTDVSDEDDAPKNQRARGRQRSKDVGKDGTDAQPSSQPKALKASSSRGPRIKVVDDGDDAGAQPKKKKKRLFPPSQAETFPWDVLPKGDGGGLNIPTQLSPVKETEAVPARSVFGKLEVTSHLTTIIDAFMSAQDSDGDADSLFGSPPPSPAPTFNRGGSPLLALPGSPGATWVALPKNVGTIALPGSHNNSELVVSLPASPPRPQTAQPAQPAPRQIRFAEWIGPRAASLPATNFRQTKPRKKKAKSKSATPGSTVGVPALTIPETSDPLPRNFLRNQQALLGLAGVVGGINPANLSTRSSRGTSVQNPIVVEEETPSISASSWKARQPQLPANVPLPSSQAIADTLVSQGNIFPVLRSLLPYFGVTTNVGCCSGHSVPQFRMHSLEPSTPNVTAPPLKRRKLNSVPAGAKDWDVPYPFPADEGPPNYLESWEKERGKKLMMQLVSLVRGAVQKATAKSYAQEKASRTEKTAEAPLGSDPFRHYRSSVMNYGKDNGLMFTQGSSNSPISPSISSSEQQATFPDFLTAIDHDADPASSLNSDFETLLSAVNDALSDPNVQLTGNDLAAMSSFGFSPAVSASPTLTSSTRLSTPCDLSPTTTTDDKENDVLPRLQDFNFGDIPIDPVLLDFSWPNFPTVGSQCPEGMIPAPASFESVSDAAGAQTTERNLPARDDTSIFDPADIPSNETSSCLLPISASVADTGTHVPLATLTQPVVPQNSASPQSSSTIQGQTPSQPKEVRFMPPMVDSTIVRGRGEGGRPAVQKLDREDVLRRARVRREQLAAEIARAKIELWETTIEQGVLTHLSKDKELLPKE